MRIIGIQSAIALALLIGSATSNSIFSDKFHSLNSWKGSNKSHKPRRHQSKVKAPEATP